MGSIYNTNNIHKIKIILVDDNILFRTAIRKLLQIQYSCNIIGEASNGSEFLNLPCCAEADLVILDIMMPIMDGLTAAELITKKFPSLKLIAVTMHNEKVYLQELINKGFKGCVFKSNIYQLIVYAMVTVMNGGLYFPDEIKVNKNYF